jgi:hypothetical protein
MHGFGERGGVWKLQPPRQRQFRQYRFCECDLHRLHDGDIHHRCVCGDRHLSGQEAGIRQPAAQLQRLYRQHPNHDLGRWKLGHQCNFRKYHCDVWRSHPAIDNIRAYSFRSANGERWIVHRHIDSDGDVLTRSFTAVHSKTGSRAGKTGCMKCPQHTCKHRGKAITALAFAQA